MKIEVKKEIEVPQCEYCQKPIFEGSGITVNTQLHSFKVDSEGNRYTSGEVRISTTMCCDCARLISSEEFVFKSTNYEALKTAIHRLLNPVKGIL